jgi:hypothetical protein
MANRRTTHGLTAIKRGIRARGLAALDGRTAAMRAIAEWKAALLADLGGEQAVSAQRMAILDVAVRTMLYLNHVDSFLLAQPSLVNRRRKAILPIVRERMQLADSLSRSLSLLGLERQQRPLTTLREYIAQHDAGEIEPETEDVPI